MRGSRGLLQGPPEVVAPRLLGWTFISAIGGVRTALSLTEVEAYGPDDPASHSFRGRTPRNRSMFEKPGTLYVYRSYGVHWCANVVVGVLGIGAAVLLRAGIPIEGSEQMAKRRGRADHLADGPGKLCQAMGITGADDGLDLLSPRSTVRLVPTKARHQPMATKRIGISKAADRNWRFVVDVRS